MADEPQSGGTEARVDWLACDWRADARAIRAHGGIGEQGSERTWLCGRGRDVAFELRHAAGRVCRRKMDRLWEQLRPLYVSLHAYVRGQLREKIRERFGSAEHGPIPAHLLGNIWSAGVEQRLSADGFAEAGAELRPDEDFAGPAHGCQGDGALRRGDFSFRWDLRRCRKRFGSGRSSRNRADRDVVCHASAWDVDFKDDLRVKMCIQITEEDFRTIHHELGHNFYQRAYNTQPPLFQNSANDGFHEAVGDTIALSVTPEYLKKIGLIDAVPPASGDIDYLLATGAGESRVSSVWIAGGQVAMGGIFRKGEAGRVQQSVVGTEAEVSGHRAAGAADGSGFRSGREISRAAETCRTRGIFWRASCNISFSGRFAARPVPRGHCIAARSTETRPPGRS